MIPVKSAPLIYKVTCQKIWGYLRSEVTLFASICFLVFSLIWTLTLARERAVEMWIFQTHPEIGLAQVK